MFAYLAGKSRAAMLTLGNYKPLVTEREVLVTKHFVLCNEISHKFLLFKLLFYLHLTVSSCYKVMVGEIKL